MTAKILEGRVVADFIDQQTSQRVATLSQREVIPGLVAVLVGDDPASCIYVKRKMQACKRLNIHSSELHLSAIATQEDLNRTMYDLNQNSLVHGVILQLPLPRHLSAEEALLILDPRKDVDGLHPVNLGRLAQLKRWPGFAGLGNLPFTLPCTPAGVMALLEFYQLSLEGKNAVVAGRSNLVGKPLASMLLAANATVTVCHTKTYDLASICREADVLVAAMGDPEAVNAHMIKHNAVVIDVGINRTPNGIFGDIHFASAKERASAITPVPGGVGPVTVAMLLWNTVLLAERQTK